VDLFITTEQSKILLNEPFEGLILFRRSRSNQFRNVLSKEINILKARRLKLQRTFLVRSVLRVEGPINVPWQGSPQSFIFILGILRPEIRVMNRNSQELVEEQEVS
jgi:hypothetical protein